MSDNREPARIGVTVQLTEEQTRALAAGQAVDIVVRLVPDNSEGAAQESAPTAGEVLPGAVSRRAVVSLDSTLPEAETLFRSAIVSLDAIPGNEIEGISPLYHVSNFDGPDAMAAVVQLHTRLDARSLIGALGTIEEAHADQIDLDLVDMEGVSSNEPDCRVPWPSAARRAQVLAPWFDMDPDARLGGDPVSFLLAMAPDAGRVGVLSDDWILGGER